MAGFATRVMMFLITVHTLLFFAGQAGYLPAQSSSPNKQFVDQLRGSTGENLTDATRQSDASSEVVAAVFSPLFLLGDFLATFGRIITFPYSFIANSPLPLMLKWIFGAFLTLFEASALASFIRGFQL